jgi:hypothetical protein
VVQKLHISWNANALRLAWSGANWNLDGDLFIYLDTAGGGAAALYDPFGTGGSLSFPATFAPDYLIWVQNDVTAALLQWSGGAWAPVQSLPAANFRHDALRTDLLLPFSLLGLTPASALQLLAVASEEDGLSLWAAAPHKNPLNSPAVISPLAQNRDLRTWRLTQFQRFPTLGAGIWPNGQRPIASDLRLSLRSAAGGYSAGYLADDLLDVLIPGAPLDANLDGQPDQPLPVAENPQPVGNGQAVAYTVSYGNSGSERAEDVRLTVTTRGALRLSDGATSRVIALGDVPAGITATVQIDALIDTSFNGQSAELNVAVADDLHGRAFDWLWVLHPVDSLPPTDVLITHPVTYALPGVNFIAGSVADASGATDLEIEITPLPAGATTTLHCVDPTPEDGAWACPWQPGSLAGLSGFDLRARASDRFGNTSAWSPVHPLIVDNAPPTVQVDAAVDGYLADGFISAAELVWSGAAQDNREVRRVAVCLDGLFNTGCASAAISQPAASVTWLHDFSGALAGDGITQTVSLHGFDGVGNRSAPLARTFLVDTVPPQLAVLQFPTARGADLAASAAGQAFSGTVSDGGGLAQMQALVTLPDGVVRAEPIAVNGNSWSYIPTQDQLGEYLIRITATDLAGNSSSAGLFALTVTAALASFEAVSVGNAVLVSWATISEEQIASFNLLRGLEPDGSDRAWLASLPAQGAGTPQGFSYDYLDEQVEGGVTYWYWLELVDLSGATTLQGPVNATPGVPTAVSLASFEVSSAGPRWAATLNRIVQWILAGRGWTPLPVGWRRDARDCCGG